MLRLVQPLGQKILIGRNAHGSAVSAMALLGLEPVWLCPRTGADLLPAPITPAQAEEALRRNPDAAAVYVTSPDYFGKLTDIAGLAEVCHRYGYRCWWTTPMVPSSSSRRRTVTHASGGGSLL